jgi:hypothetical protein
MRKYSTTNKQISAIVVVAMIQNPSNVNHKSVLSKDKKAHKELKFSSIYLEKWTIFNEAFHRAGAVLHKNCKSPLRKLFLKHCLADCSPLTSDSNARHNQILAEPTHHRRHGRGDRRGAVELPK